MALRRIVLQGEDCLTKVCRPVTDFDNRLHILLNDMADTLLDSGGVGGGTPGGHFAPGVRSAERER